jgi:hypothetical protein
MFVTNLFYNFFLQISLFSFDGTFWSILTSIEKFYLTEKKSNENLVKKKFVDSEFEFVKSSDEQIIC